MTQITITRDDKAQGGITCSTCPAQRAIKRACKPGATVSVGCTHAIFSKLPHVDDAFLPDSVQAFIHDNDYTKFDKAHTPNQEPLTFDLDVPAWALKEAL